MSLREALQLGHNYIGTEHILLGLIREGEGVAAQVLVKLGVGLREVRERVVQLLTGAGGTAEAVVTVPPVDPEGGPRCPRCGADLRQQSAYRMTDAGALVFCLRCNVTIGSVGPRPAPA
jgi:ATP-dependent Clp protease ATP-binding subunit ClpC